jgi:hypothetical protein
MYAVPCKLLNQILMYDPTCTPPHDTAQQRREFFRPGKGIPAAGMKAGARTGYPVVSASMDEFRGDLPWSF